ncbi:MAG: ChuX/HutX family heme-like substrate-binding protein [Pseudomonadota bacterium]
MELQTPNPEELRQLIEANDTLRQRDVAVKLGVAEAQIVAAQVGRGVTAIHADPDKVVAGVCGLGEVMALTRNVSAVHERTGVYKEYHPGTHAAMVLGPDIDLRIFPKHWVHGFAVHNDSGKGPSRSLQVYDAAGTAVHKVYPREGTDLNAWDQLVAALTLDEQSDVLGVEAAPPPEGARMIEDKAEVLRKEWRRMTDTHQFLRLVSKFKMNRLGAYRIAGAPFARPLAPTAVDAALHALSAEGTPTMLFVGNRGCIQIHSGPIETLKAMGPWQNVLDPRFNLHLRLDHIAEVWLVEKPTRRGPALSVEAFNADGALILQFFGMRKENADYTEAFAKIAEALPELEPAE